MKKLMCVIAAVAALTGGKTRFDVKLVQMVRLLRAGAGRHPAENRHA